jgi:hypothetical protein
MRRGASMRGCAERMTCPPLLFQEVSIAAGRNAYLLRSSRPPSLGVSLALRLQVGVLRQGASKLAVSYMKAPESESLCRKHREGAPQQTKCCLGGSDAAKQGAGGMFHALHNLQQSSLTHHSTQNPKAPRAGHRPRTQRQVCPPPEALAEIQGGRGRARARAAGGARHHENHSPASS